MTRLLLVAIDTASSGARADNEAPWVAIADASTGR